MSGPVSISAAIATVVLGVCEEQGRDVADVLDAADVDSDDLELVLVGGRALLLDELYRFAAALGMTTADLLQRAEAVRSS